MSSHKTARTKGSQDRTTAIQEMEKMMERIVIVAYRPKPGCGIALNKLVDAHHSRLQAEALVSKRLPIIVRAINGDIIEVFGWRSAEAIELAHSNEAVQKMWTEFAEVCDFVPVSEVPEAAQLFSEFTPC